MQSLHSQAESSPQAAPPPGRPCCPVCNGPLVPLRDAYRCARCLFTLCVGCDVGAAGADAGGD